MKYSNETLEKAFISLFGMFRSYDGIKYKNILCQHEGEMRIYKEFRIDERNPEQKEKDLTDQYVALLRSFEEE